MGICKKQKRKKKKASEKKCCVHLNLPRHQSIRVRVFLSRQLPVLPRHCSLLAGGKIYKKKKKKKKKDFSSNSQICDFPLLANRWKNRISEAIIDVISVFCKKPATPFLAWLWVFQLLVIAWLSKGRGGKHISVSGSVQRYCSSTWVVVTSVESIWVTSLAVGLCAHVITAFIREKFNSSTFLSYLYPLKSKSYLLYQMKQFVFNRLVHTLRNPPTLV